MTEYWPCLLAAVCAIAVLRCAARQRHGMRSLLAGAVCGLGVLALLGLLEPVTGIALPLNRFTAFCAGVLGTGLLEAHQAAHEGGFLRG